MCDSGEVCGGIKANIQPGWYSRICVYSKHEDVSETVVPLLPDSLDRRSFDALVALNECEEPPYAIDIIARGLTGKICDASMTNDIVDNLDSHHVESTLARNARHNPSLR